MARSLVVLLAGVLLTPAWAWAQTMVVHPDGTISTDSPLTLRSQSWTICTPDGLPPLTARWRVERHVAPVPPRIELRTPLDARQMWGAVDPPYSLRGWVDEGPAGSREPLVLLRSPLPGGLGGPLGYVGELGPAGSPHRIGVYCPGGAAGSWLYGDRCMERSRVVTGSGGSFRVVPLAR